MKTNTPLILTSLYLVLALASAVPAAHGNVYATGVKIDGNLTGTVSASSGSPVTISYILNEPATAGVTVNIWSNSAVIRTIPIPSGTGTNPGSNAVIWDGKNQGGVAVTAGTYSVSVTAAATGYTNWTQISDDGDTNRYVFAPRGIAVNRNTTSPYYGRVFIANSTAGPGVDTNNLGDVQGILMRNADGTPTDDGAFGQAAYGWADDGGNSPIHLKVKEDDRLYFNDWTGRGKIVASDMQLSSHVVVLDAPNYGFNPFSTTANWINFEVLDAGTTNARIFLTDAAAIPSAGVWMWHMVNNGSGDWIADPDDQTGTQVVAAGGSLSLRCDGIAIDANTNIYVIQNRANPGDASMRAAKFANWDGQSVLTSGAAWVVGGGDDSFRNLYGFALDSVTNPQILACPMFAAGTAGANGSLGGGIRLLNAADGSPIYSEPNTIHSLLPFYEPFADESAEGGTSYAVDDGLAGQTNRFGEGWGLVGSNNSGGAQPVIAAGNLSYTGLPASTGNSVAVVPSVGMTARLAVSATATTDMYYSLLLKITDVSAVPTSPGNNFIAAFSDALGEQAGTLSRSAAKLLTIQSDDGYRVGIGKGHGTAAVADYQYDPTVRNLNDVLFIVAQYQRVGGVTNVNLWVNPDSSTFGAGSPPTPTAAITFGAANNDLNANGVRSIVLSCQNSTAPSAIIDDVRVGKNWSSVTGGTDPDAPAYVSNLTATVFYRSANWDNVGNLYAGSQTLGRWRVFSPPGPNEATTAALASLEVGGGIHITSITVTDGTVIIKFTGATDDSADAFTLQSSSAVTGTYTDAVGANIVQLSPGAFQASVAAGSSGAFYRIKR
jgi:hypothetical protein